MTTPLMPAPTNSPQHTAMLANFEALADESRQMVYKSLCDDYLRREADRTERNALYDEYVAGRAALWADYLAKCNRIPQG